MQGRPGLDEDVVSVTTFRGSGFLPGASTPDGASLLTLPQGAVYTDAQRQRFDATGYSQGMAFESGSGRVYASGEAGMFSAQHSGPASPFGMHALPFDHNQQFLLNVLHWLDGLL